MGRISGRPAWPDSIDSSTIFLFVLLAFGLPFLGYFLLALDIRAYLRSLRGALLVVTHFVTEAPRWEHHRTPYCLRALGLTVPCTEKEVKEAYRRLAKEMHPDRGGDIARFRKLNHQFEKALQYVQEEPQQVDAEGG